jgi:hypothetical protein
MNSMGTGSIEVESKNFPCPALNPHMRLQKKYSSKG